MSGSVGTISHPLRERGLRMARGCLLAQLLLVLASWFFSSHEIEIGEFFSNLLCPLFNICMWVGLFLPWLYDLLRGRNEFQDQLLFIRQLGDLLRIGMPLPEALEALTGKERQGWRTRFCRVAQAARVMASSTAAGDGLGESMARVGMFPHHWPLLLQAAESRGVLVEVLEELEVGRSPRPWFTPTSIIRFFNIVFMAVPITLFYVTYIGPTYVQLFEGMNLYLPLPTRILVTVVKFMQSSMLVLPLTILGLWLLWTWSQSAVNPAMGRRFRNLFFSLPMITKVIRLEEQAVVATTLASCERLGLPPLDALAVAGAAVDVPAYQKALLRTEPCQLGPTLSQSPQLFAAPLLWLVTQGEAYGNLEEALAAAGSYLREEADAQKARCVEILDAVATCGIGAVTALMVFGFSLPVFQLVGTIAERAVMP